MAPVLLGFIGKYVVGLEFPHSGPTKPHILVYGVVVHPFFKSLIQNWLQDFFFVVSCGRLEASHGSRPSLLLKLDFNAQSLS